MAGVQNRKMNWVISLLLVMLLFSGLPAQAQYSGGSGTAEDPYLIYTAEQLNEIGLHEDDWDKHFKLMADIDLGAFTGTNFTIIGYYVDWDDNKPFTGVFDGSGHTISNFSYTSTDANNIGLFGYVGTWGKEAVIKDLGLIDPNIDSETGDYVGSLIGWLRNGTITSCYVEGGFVSGNENIGGLVGAHGGTQSYLEPPPFTISNCYSTAIVVGHDCVGGLVGSNYEGRIADCYATGSVSGQERVGGLVGQNGGSGGWMWGPPIPGTILNCYSTGLVSGGFKVGGLVGLHVEGTVIGCFWDMETSGQTTSAIGAGKTTVEMKTADTFFGWGGCSSEGFWTIDEGNDYPRLWWENKPGKLLEGQLSDFLQGAGTEDDPYLIYTGEQFSMIGRFPCEWDKHFKLMHDIELGEYVVTSFNLIGYNQYYPFSGVLDGNGHTISNFTYDCNGVNYIGLFGYVDIWEKEAVIKDLGLIDPNIDAGTGGYVGSLVGCLKNGTIAGCHVDDAAIKAGYAVGGLIGSNNDGQIVACYATGSVTGTHYVGGLVGENSFYKYWSHPVWASWGFGSIEDSYAVCNVTGTQYIGGLVGYNQKGGTIYNCYSVSQVAGESDMGGLVGGSKGNVISAFWDIQTSGLTTSSGGIGKTTAELQTASRFLDAGWDFVDETENGTDDIWWILEGQSYPRLWWELFWAVSPYPQDGAFDVTQPLILQWTSGRSALHHDVYFGEDEEAVKNATTSSPEYKSSTDLGSESYDPGKLELDTTYYWRIDEVNNTNPDSPWKGNTWSFTTANFIVVDDFESYNDLDPGDPKSNRIFNTWLDGYDDPNNGSIVGYLVWSWFYWFVHSGEQSMPFSYDNSGPANYSEATANIDNLAIDQDWAIEGARVLSLWFRGNSDNAPELMYVALANADGSIAAMYHDNPDAALIEVWTEWRIDLQAFANQGVDLTNIDTISIGFGDKDNPEAGGSGQMHFDDIRLYRPPPETAP